MGVFPLCAFVSFVVKGVSGFRKRPIQLDAQFPCWTHQTIRSA